MFTVSHSRNKDSQYGGTADVCRIVNPFVAIGRVLHRVSFHSHPPMAAAVDGYSLPKGLESASGGFGEEGQEVFFGHIQDAAVFGAGDGVH